MRFICPAGLMHAVPRGCVWVQVESDESLAKVTTEAQREAFLSQLNDMEDWLYGDGDAASAKEYRCGSWIGPCSSAGKGRS